ncbi:latrotoxin-related protein [Wolbachia endosymbiont (group B) of Villa cingulata]|uniref:latrotoxin-related protein n=1 Tax=Wolbachia endosymbiont (group B) of Villa cingulata TaxID=3066157 RepID=UPI0033402CDB
MHNVKTRVIENELKKTSRFPSGFQVEGSKLIKNMKITNDLAFWSLAREKEAHGDILAKELGLLRDKIYSKMGKTPFTICEISYFCKKNNINFSENDLLLLIPKKESKYYINYEAHSVRKYDSRYLTSKVKVEVSYRDTDLVCHPDYKNYIADATIYKAFLECKLAMGKGLSACIGKQSSQVENESFTFKAKEIEYYPINIGYTKIEFNLLLEKIYSKLWYTPFSTDEIKLVYSKYNIKPPMDIEFESMKSLQEEKRSIEFHEKVKGLPSQGVINIKLIQESTNNQLDFNIELFQNMPLEDLTDDNKDGVINNRGILKALKSTIEQFNANFGIAQNNRSLPAHEAVVYFRLFLFDDKGSYENKVQSRRSVGETQFCDHIYIANIYSRNDDRNFGDYNSDGEVNYKDRNYVIKHEFVHGLTYYATSKFNLGKVFMEGLAEYISSLTEGKRSTDFAALVSKTYYEYNLEEIIEGEIDPYKTGTAVVAYIQEIYPYFIGNLLYSAKEAQETLNGRFYFRQMIQKLYNSEAEKVKIGEGFGCWLQTQLREKEVPSNYSKCAKAYSVQPAASNARKVSSWINDLFSWVRSSIGELLSSKPALSEEASSTPSPISQVDASMDVNGTIMLLDVLVRKVKGQKYISTADQYISPLEAQGYALNITKGFEKVVEQAAKDSKISMHRLNIDFMKVEKEITGKIIGGKFNEIAGVLSSYVEKACPGREAGCPGKLNPKKFGKFITEFNNTLDVALNQSMQQILHSRSSALEVSEVKEQQISLEPRSYLNNTSVQGHLAQGRNLRLG